MQKHRKAIALISGGLDSALAAKVVQEQGVEVVGLFLTSPFGCRVDIDKVASHLGIRVIKRGKGEPFLDLIKHPKYGYGKNMNPCVDCRINMFQLAEQVMVEEEADFVVTGEVVGQRPMSQLRHRMELIDSHTSLKGKLVRPLSAKFFEPTIAEQQGWLDRNRLFGIAGRSRKGQLALAVELGITQYGAPGGGCLLTESSFSSRVRDFFAHDGVGSEMRLAQSEMLRLGRHFRLSEKIKVIVGRNELENQGLAGLWRPAGAQYFHPVGFRGPDAVAIGEIAWPEIELIGRIVLRYSKGVSQTQQTLQWETATTKSTVNVRGTVEERELSQWRI